MPTYVNLEIKTNTKMCYAGIRSEGSLETQGNSPGVILTY
jgi:hypothetical protein